MAEMTKRQTADVKRIQKDLKASDDNLEYIRALLVKNARMLLMMQKKPGRLEEAKKLWRTWGRARRLFNDLVDEDTKIKNKILKENPNAIEQVKQHKQVLGSLGIAWFLIPLVVIGGLAAGTIIAIKRHNKKVLPAQYALRDTIDVQNQIIKDRLADKITSAEAKSLLNVTERSARDLVKVAKGAPFIQAGFGSGVGIIAAVAVGFVLLKGGLGGKKKRRRR